MESGHDTKEISKIRIIFLKLLSWVVDNMGHCFYSVNHVSKLFSIRVCITHMFRNSHGPSDLSSSPCFTIS